MGKPWLEKLQPYGGKKYNKLHRIMLGWLFGVTSVKSEYLTSSDGRINILGIHENNCPDIFEYKR
ncbi:MAG: hypothetical protein ABFC94_14730 [Syntrophomonas sp.]